MPYRGSDAGAYKFSFVWHKNSNKVCSFNNKSRRRVKETSTSLLAAGLVIHTMCWLLLEECQTDMAIQYDCQINLDPCLLLVYCLAKQTKTPASHSQARKKHVPSQTEAELYWFNSFPHHLPPQSLNDLTVVKNYVGRKCHSVKSSFFVLTGSSLLPVLAVSWHSSFATDICH